MRIFFIAICVLSMLGCGNEGKKTTTSSEEGTTLSDTTAIAKTPVGIEAYVSFGKPIDQKETISAQEMKEKYEILEVGDTLTVKFAAVANEVCKKKGCWMKLTLSEEEESMVRFKDYSFFVPKDIEGKKVIVHGKAYITEMSVEKQRHYAQDGGKSEAEIAAITEPKRTLAFDADGVLVKK